MDNEEIIEGNKLIAEFMGFIRYFPNMTLESDLSQVYYYPYMDRVFDEGLYTPTIKTSSQQGHYSNQSIRESHHLKDMQFFKSWGWLMPVIKKAVNAGIYHSDWTNQLHDGLLNQDIDDCWGACVEFIKWYNKNKENEKV